MTQLCGDQRLQNKRCCTDTRYSCRKPHVLKPAADVAQPAKSSCTAPYELQLQHSHAKSATLRSSRLHTLASAVGGNTLQEIPDQQFCFLRRAAAFELRVCGSKCFNNASECGSVSGSLDSFPAN